MKKLPLLFTLALLLNLAGCLPVSQNPLSSIENATPDPRLPGVWYGKSSEDEIFLHFVSGDSAEMQVVEVDHEKKGAAHTTLYTLIPSTIGDQRYLSIREGKDKPYYLAHYQVANGTLKIWLMSDKILAKAVKAGKLKGTFSEKKQGDGSVDRDITITDTSEHLAAFVKKSEPEKLFDQKFGTFKKVTLPSIEPEAASSGKSAPSKHKKKGN
jgi:hypothetical protein